MSICAEKKQNAPSVLIIYEIGYLFVSQVNSSGNVIYDKHVKPTEKVTDFRTKVSGVRPSNLKKGKIQFIGYMNSM
jgi:hypothetical protein